MVWPKEGTGLVRSRGNGKRSLAPFLARIRLLGQQPLLELTDRLVRVVKLRCLPQMLLSEQHTPDMFCA